MVLSCYGTLLDALRDQPYRVLLLDAYGVFWAGGAKGPFPGAPAAMEQLVSSGKIVGILSNTTALSSSEEKKYSKWGLEKGRHFHFVQTSGDLAKALFSSQRLPFVSPNRSYILFCPPSPQYPPPTALFEGSPYQETKMLAEADFIYLNVPQFQGKDCEDLDLFRPRVEELAASHKPMICANPDTYAQEGDPPRMVVRQGAIASLYEKAGGSVVYVGKPFSQMFSSAVEKICCLKSQILMIGDTPETDVLGANGFGIPSALMIDQGIMAERLLRDPDALQKLPEKNRPNHFIKRFAAYGV